MCIRDSVSTQTAGEASDLEGIGCLELNLAVGTCTATCDDGRCGTHVVRTVEALGLQSRTTRTGVVTDADCIATRADQFDGAAFGDCRDAGFAGFTVDRVSQGRQVGYCLLYTSRCV